ncbi:MAG: hypothetical protein KFH87_12920 [Bacteroidetes bacterium]|nr:hypothetical protein [Bacteroidota bacterium]
MSLRSYLTGLPASIVFLTGFLPVLLHGQTVNGLTAYHYSGQTFLSWNSAGPAVTQYTVYRARKPLRTALALLQAEQQYVVAPGSALNRRLSEILKRPIFYRLPGPEGALNALRECLVVTSTGNGQWYYAVTAGGPRGEYRQLRAAANTLIQGVREQVAMPDAVHQGRFSWEQRKMDIFAHWGTDTDLPNFPAMSNLSSQAFLFALRKNGVTRAHPLVVRLHGRGDHFLNSVHGAGSPFDYILALDDYLPGTGSPTFWFGYDRGMDILGRAPLSAAPGLGVVDYTMRRLRWTVDWARRKLPIDINRVYLVGASMGGSAAAFSLFTFGDRIAAAMSVIPRLQYPNGEDSPKGAGAQRLFRALWGDAGRRPRMSDGRSVYTVLDFARRLQWSDLRLFPPLRVISGKRDSVVGWQQAIRSMRVADSLSASIGYFWDKRGHASNGNFSWVPQQHLISLWRYRTNRSFPVFSRVSRNDDPQRTAPGGQNVVVDWFEPVIDETDTWSVGIRRAALEMRDSLFIIDGTLTADITPRRLQRFRITGGRLYRWTLRSSGRDIASGTIRAQQHGQLTIPTVPIPDMPARIEIRLVSGPTQ